MNDRHEVVRTPSNAQRNQQRHRRLRPICCARQRIQPKDRNSCRNPDMLGVLFTRRQRLAKKDVTE